MVSSWSEVRQGHLRIRYKVATRKGKEIVTHLCVETHPDAGEPQSIKASELAQIKPRDLARGYSERLLDFTDSELFRSQTRLGKGELLRHAPVAPFSDDHMAHVAGLMRLFLRQPIHGMSATSVIQSLYGVSPATAHRWMARARKIYPDLPPRQRGPEPKGGTDHG